MRLTTHLSGSLHGGYVVYTFHSSDPVFGVVNNPNSFYVNASVNHVINERVTQTLSGGKELRLGIFSDYTEVYRAQYGLDWNVSARDQAMPPLEGMAGRLQRALRNFSESFPLFAVSVLTAVIAGKLGTLTDWGVQLYFWGRVVYLPLYAFGIPIARTIAWTVAMVGIILNLVALL